MPRDISLLGLIILKKMLRLKSLVFLASLTILVDSPLSLVSVLLGKKKRTSSRDKVIMIASKAALQQQRLI